LFNTPRGRRTWVATTHRDTKHKKLMRIKKGIKVARNGGLR